MKVLTALQMREVDRQTEEIGISGEILMENAGYHILEFLIGKFPSLVNQRILVLCGKGNNGGDGYVVARQILTRFRFARLDVVSAFPSDITGPRRMFEAVGGSVGDQIYPQMFGASIVVDALLGTGISGPARGRTLELIQQVNAHFPRAFILAVDVPSGMSSDTGTSEGDVMRADATVTFTAPKPCHVLAPNCDRVGELRVGRIGSPDRLMDQVPLHLNGPEYFRHLLRPRPAESNKGSYGHALIVGGETGKSGAPRMTGLAALRAGAGLVTVASSAVEPGVPELMTVPLPGSWDQLGSILQRKNVLAIGPGLGTEAPHVRLVLDALDRAEQPMVLDADALNAIAGHSWKSDGRIRVLTPHPGEMSRLTGLPTGAIQSDRLQAALDFAQAHACTLVLKGHRTVIATPDGMCWINPTGTPALATGGTGDMLTGLIAGLLAQYPEDPLAAVLGAVYLHGLSAQLAEKKWGDKSLIATDILPCLPEAMRECTLLSDRL